VLQLVEAGQIELDRPVGDALAQLVDATVADPAVAAITVRHLLSHTSGFPSYQGTFFGGRVDSRHAVAQRACRPTSPRHRVRPLDTRTSTSASSAC
jgi:CubicO group peptidase (beta-lactamase class C family)